MTTKIIAGPLELARDFATFTYRSRAAAWGYLTDEVRRALILAEAAQWAANQTEPLPPEQLEIWMAAVALLSHDSNRFIRRTAQE